MILFENCLSEDVFERSFEHLRKTIVSRSCHDVKLWRWVLNWFSEPECLPFCQHKVRTTQPPHCKLCGVYFWAQAEVKHPLFLLLADSIVLLLSRQWSHFFFFSLPLTFYIRFFLMCYFTLSFLLSAFSLPLCSSVTQKGSDGCWLKWLVPKRCVLGKPVPCEPRECVVLWDLVREQKRSLGYCII